MARSQTRSQTEQEGPYFNHQSYPQFVEDPERVSTARRCLSARQGADVCNLPAVPWRARAEPLASASA